MIRRRMTCPLLIGRGEQQRLLSQAVSDIRPGRGKVVVITGEARIGKSHLVAEPRQEAEGRGMTCLTTQCFEQDMSLPHAPFVDLLRSLVGSPMSDRNMSCCS